MCKFFLHIVEIKKGLSPFGDSPIISESTYASHPALHVH